MAYVKWVANQDRHNDWTSEEILSDGTVVRMGEPVELKAEVRKEMEARGRIFEESSAEEAKEVRESPEASQPVGADVAGTAPVFQSVSGGSNQQSDTDQGGDARKRS